MEESGHYYSVYYVSLAVGFLNRIAKQHAFFAQMPDEVSMLDAFDQEVSYLWTTGDIPISRAVANSWRLRVEHGIHALTGKGVDDERRMTRQLLLATRDTDFLRIGLLLHRFGDTYAHTQLDDPTKLYKADPAFPIVHRKERLAGHGHYRHGHEPDEPWGKNRKDLMKQYLTALYEIFDTLAQKTDPSNLRPTLRTNKVSLPQVIEDFTMAEQAVGAMIQRRQEECTTERSRFHLRTPPACVNQDVGAQQVYISVLRSRIIERTGGISFERYAPESQGTLFLEEFREQYRSAYTALEQYDADTIRAAVRQLNIDTDTIPSPAY